MNYSDIVTAEEMQDARQWLGGFLSVPDKSTAPGSVDIHCIRQVWGDLTVAQSVLFGIMNLPLCLNGQTYATGLSTHADSEIQLRLSRPGKRLIGLAGVEDNELTRQSFADTLIFSVEANGQTLWSSGAQAVNSPPARLDIDLGGQQELILKVAGPAKYNHFIPMGHADWADLQVVLDDGQIVKVGQYDELGRGVSFRYGGRHSDEFLAGWDYRQEHLPEVDGIALHRIIRTDPQTKLQLTVEIKEYTRFPVVEWIARFKNTGNADTPILEDIRSMDVNVRSNSILHHYNGDYCAPDSYAPHTATLDNKTKLTFAPVNGRPTSTVWPYYNVAYPMLNRGLIMVVGWSGQWAAQFTGKEGSGIRVSAGQELTHLKLRPGEEIRTPISALMFWRGDLTHSHNLWRRWMMACNMPRPGGKLPAPILPATSSFWFNEMGTATEENQKEFIDRYLKEGIPLDYWWMDAGWYPCDGNWQNVGTWEVDTKRFPHGLRAVSDHAHQKGMKTIVWFEPERVKPGTALYEQHPGWLLSLPKESLDSAGIPFSGEAKLFDFGNPEARRWLIEHVDGLIREQGIDLYRQDCCIDLLPYWRANDAPDRQGITEIRHVEGYLTYWDELRRRHPTLLIDSCAGGGQRNDLETMRRAVPLHKTDYGYDRLTVKQAFHHTLSLWLPFYGTLLCPVAHVDTYAARSAICQSMCLPYDARRSDLDYAQLRKLIAEWRQVASYWGGDYYPLTSYNREDDLWIAWQFHDPDRNGGVIQAFRRKDSPYETARLQLSGLDANSTYIIEDLDQPDRKLELGGKELMETGLAVTLPGKPRAGVLIYRRQA